MSRLFYLTVMSIVSASGLVAEELGDAFASEIAMAQSTKPKKPKSQKLIKKTKHQLVFDIELDSGYRQDNLHFFLASNTGRPSTDTQNSTAYLWQSNLILQMMILNHGYINVMGGYGLLINNRANYQTVYITAPLTTYHSSKINGGYAADYEVQGGGYFNIWKHCVRLAPELGYAYKRLKANNAYAETFQAPYAGVRGDFMLSEKHRIHLIGFYDYFFSISRSDTNYAYDSFNQIYIQNNTVTGGSMYAYKTGAALTYSPFRHWSFGLKYQYFYLKADPHTVSISSGIYSGRENMRWISQNAQVSVDYRF